MMKNFVMFLLLSLSSFAALAVPTVTEVETKIANGEYNEAKQLIEEVLKKHPDSYVANRYMLEILNLQYAQDLKPSVAYKLYENRLAEIEKSIAAKKKAIAEAKAAEERAQVGRVLGYVVLFFVLAGAIAAFVLLVIPRYKAAQAEKLKKRKAEERLREWKSDTMPDLIDLNQILQDAAEDDKYAKLTNQQKQLIKDLYEDNLDAIGCLNRDDFNTDLIDRHIRNARDYLGRHGFI